MYKFLRNTLRPFCLNAKHLKGGIILCIEILIYNAFKISVPLIYVTKSDILPTRPVDNLCLQRISNVRKIILSYRKLWFYN